MVGTSIGAAFASSTQENPPAADSANPADIFRASRRFRSKVMQISAGVSSNDGTGDVAVATVSAPAHASPARRKPSR
jgi:hypothetical protein